MSKKLDALMSTLNDEKVSVIHDNGPAGPNVVAFIDTLLGVSDQSCLTMMLSFSIFITLPSSTYTLLSFRVSFTFNMSPSLIIPKTLLLVIR